jgi:hypothetical protein
MSDTKIRDSAKAALDKFLGEFATDPRQRQLMRPFIEGIWNLCAEHYEGILQPIESRLATKDQAIDRAIDDRQRLHRDIMNIPCKVPPRDGLDWNVGYRSGHCDARHAAAELVLGGVAPGGGEAGE